MSIVYDYRFQRQSVYGPFSIYYGYSPYWGLWRRWMLNKPLPFFCPPAGDTGPGTPYPIGFTDAEITDLFFYVKSWQVQINITRAAIPQPSPDPPIPPYTMSHAFAWDNHYNDNRIVNPQTRRDCLEIFGNSRMNGGEIFFQFFGDIHRQGNDPNFTYWPNIVLWVVNPGKRCGVTTGKTDFGSAGELLFAGKSIPLYAIYADTTYSGTARIDVNSRRPPDG